MAFILEKTLTIASGEVIFSNDDLTPTKPNRARTHNFIDISSAVSPTGGNFLAYAETSPNSGFKSIPSLTGTDNNVPAANTGAGVADGDADGWSFSGNPYRIKVVADSVTGVTEVNVIVTQNVN